MDEKNMQRLLAAVGAQGTVLHAIALNDYAVTMPVDRLVASEGFLDVSFDGGLRTVRQLLPCADQPVRAVACDVRHPPEAVAHGRYGHQSISAPCLRLGDFLSGHRWLHAL